MKHTAWLFAALAMTGALISGALGCDSKPDQAPQPKTSTLADSKPAAAGAAEFEIGKDSAKVTFMMEAPNEKIRGTVDKATSGKLQVPLDDITKTTGHLYVDLAQLRLWQSKPKDDFKEETEHPLQNEHAREWLQIQCKGVPEDKLAECEAESKKNKNVEFVIEKVETDTKDLTKLTGDERKITATVTGNFLLHQVAKQRSAKMELIFKMKGDKPESLTIKTVEGFSVKLLDHDVQPNNLFGKFAKETLGTLDSLINEEKKLAEAAEVSLDFTAAFTGMTTAGNPKPAGSSASSSQ